MSDIRIMDLIKWGKKGVQVRDANDTYTGLHQQQGTLDGACAVYSIVMALLAHGVFLENDLDVYKKGDKRGPKGKLLSMLLEEQGFIKGGYSFKTLKSEMMDYADKLNFSLIRRDPEEGHAEMISQYIDDENPVVISVVGKYVNHALLAVGYERNSEDRVTKILCLDPGVPAPKYAPWNCYIDVASNSKSDFPFYYSAGDCAVYLDDMIAVLPAEKSERAEQVN